MAFGLHRFSRRRYAPAWLTLVVGLAATAALGWHLQREAVALDRQRLALRIKETVDQLDGRLEKTELLLRQLQDYLIFSGATRNRVFNDWCSRHGLFFNFPWVHGIAVATNRYEAQWRQELPKPPEAWTANDWATLRELARKQPIECDIALKSGVREQRQFLADYHLKGLLQDANLFARAIRGQHMHMSERRTVMRDAKGNHLIGTMFYAPVYQAEAADFQGGRSWSQPERAAPTRWLHLRSMILAPIDFQALEKAVWGGLTQDLGVEIFSTTNQIAETWLNISADSPHAADPQFNAYLTHRLPWPMYGNQFSIFFYTTPLFENQSPRRLARIAIVAGTAMTLLATVLVGVALRAGGRQELMTEQIREARDALAAAQQEREQFSHDLHDGTIQSLYALQLGLGHTVEKLEVEPVNARRELSAVRGELDRVIAEIRRFITAEANADQPIDFCAVLDALVERARAVTTALIVVRCDPGAADRLTGGQAVQLANVIREAISNSLRHARPQRVEITLRPEPATVVLEIADDGIGFDPQSQVRGVGLTSMTTRTREMGGTLDIQSSPGRGTRVVIRVPAVSLEDGEQNGGGDEADKS